MWCVCHTRLPSAEMRPTACHGLLIVWHFLVSRTNSETGINEMHARNYILRVSNLTCQEWDKIRRLKLWQTNQLTPKKRSVLLDCCWRETAIILTEKRGRRDYLRWQIASAIIPPIAPQTTIFIIS